MIHPRQWNCGRSECGSHHLRLDMVLCELLSRRYNLVESTAVQLQTKLVNAVFLPHAFQYVKTKLVFEDLFRLSPTDKLRNGIEVVPASNLVVGEKDSTEKAHFCKFHVESNVHEWLLNNLETLFRKAHPPPPPLP